MIHIGQCKSKFNLSFLSAQISKTFNKKFVPAKFHSKFRKSTFISLIFNPIIPQLLPLNINKSLWLCLLFQKKTSKTEGKRVARVIKSQEFFWFGYINWERRFEYFFGWLRWIFLTILEFFRSFLGKFVTIRFIFVWFKKSQFPYFPFKFRSKRGESLKYNNSWSV